MQAKQGAQTIPSLSEDGQQQRKNKIAVDTRESSHDSTPGQTDNAKPGPVGVVSNKASAVTKDISFARAVKGPDKSEVPGPVAVEKRAGGDFRLSNQERRSILKSNFTINWAASRRDVHGISTALHRIKSAGDSKPKFLVYLGTLAAKTSCDDVRCHLLSDNNINNVADVSLNRNRFMSRQSFFCISRGDEESVLPLFDCTIWPFQVVIRPFRLPRPNKYDRLRTTKSRHQVQGPVSQKIYDASYTLN